MLDTIINGISAFGTLLACVISLWLSTARYRHKLDCVFIWCPAEEYKPTLLINNLCDKTIVIDHIEISYNRKKLAKLNISEDFHFRESYIISAKSEVRMYINACEFNLSSIKEPLKPFRKQKNALIVVVYTTSGKKFVSRQTVVYDKMQELLFGYALFSN